MRVLVPLRFVSVVSHFITAPLCLFNYSESNPDQPCDCKDGFHGPHCEFTTPLSEQKCDLGCQNGGSCVRGFSGLNQAKLQYGQSGFFTEADYQWCDCPEGTEGVHCEHQTNIDGERKCGGRFPCQNGGECVTVVDEVNGGSKDQCDCSKANNGTHYFAGKVCQHVSTSFCSLNIDQNGKPFCVNGGTCREGGT